MALQQCAARRATLLFRFSQSRYFFYAAAGRSSGGTVTGSQVDIKHDGPMRDRLGPTPLARRPNETLFAVRFRGSKTKNKCRLRNTHTIRLTHKFITDAGATIAKRSYSDRA